MVVWYPDSRSFVSKRWNTRSLKWCFQTIQIRCTSAGPDFVVIVWPTNYNPKQAKLLKEKYHLSLRRLTCATFVISIVVWSQLSKESPSKNSFVPLVFQRILCEIGESHNTLRLLECLVKQLEGKEEGRADFKLWTKRGPERTRDL